jgi:hypothetical protein
MKNTLLYKVLIHLKQNVLRSMVYKATKLQKQNTVQLLPFDEDNTYFYQLDESYCWHKQKGTDEIEGGWLVILN